MKNPQLLLATYCQGFITMKKYFLIFRGNIPHFSLGALPLVLALGIRKRAWLHPLCTFTSDETPLSLVFSRLSSHHSLSLSSYERSLYHPCSPLLILSGMFVSLELGEPRYGPGLPDPQQWAEGRILSPDLLALLVLMQPRIPFAFPAAFLTHIQSGAHQHHAKLLSSWAASSMYQCLRLFFPTCRSFYFYLLNFTMLLLAHFSSLLKVPLDVIMILRPISQFGVISKCAEGALCPTIQTIKENVEGDWTQYW